MEKKRREGKKQAPISRKRVLISTVKSEREVLPPKASYTRFFSHAADELKSFRLCIRWLCVDHSDAPRAIVSWFPPRPFRPRRLLLIYSPDCRPYDLAGHRRFLFIDKLIAESERVHHGYAIQLNSSFRLLP